MEILEMLFHKPNLNTVVPGQERPKIFSLRQFGRKLGGVVGWVRLDKTISIWPNPNALIPQVETTESGPRCPNPEIEMWKTEETRRG